MHSTENNDSRYCILIIGMHRSGTSAITGCISKFGYTLGKHLISDDKHNEKGYFENSSINSFNEDLLELLGACWHDTLFLPDNWWNDRRIVSKKAELAKLLDDEFSINSNFIIKDPRISVLLPLYLETLKKLNITSKIIINYRNPFEVAESLKKRDNLSLSKSLLLWMDSTLKAEFYSRSYPRLFLNYNSLLNDPVSTIHRINIALQLNIEITNERKNELGNFIEPRLKHNTAKLNSEDQEIPRSINQLFELLQKLDFQSGKHQNQKLFKKISQSFFSDFQFFNGVDKAFEVILKTFDYENKSMRYYVEGNTNSSNIQFILDNTSPISEFWIYPINRRVSLQLINLQVKNANGKFIQIKINETNAEKVSEDGLMIFESEFPLLKIKLDEPSIITQINFELHFIAFSTYTYRSSVKERNSYEEELLLKISQLQEDSNTLISKHETVLTNLKTKIVDLDEELIKNQNLSERKLELSERKLESEILRHIEEIKSNNDRFSKELIKNKEKLKALMTSRSWKIGRFITWPIRRSKEKHRHSKNNHITTAQPVSEHIFSKVKLLKKIIWKVGIKIFIGFPVSNTAKENLKQKVYYRFGKHITAFKGTNKIESSNNGLSITHQLETYDTQKDSQFISYSENKPLRNSPIKVLAFFLPQFHSIPENDKWWGKGFTEWVNVKPAKPQFKGHYQAHIPGDLGYYNLLNINTLQRQVELAKNYGVNGFCFHFYWFNGKRLLEKPIENYLGNPQLDLPFCLSWANENWTRRWDGNDAEILIKQQHSPEDDLSFIKYIAKYMQDKRYIRINNKPLLMVYRPGLLPSAKNTTKIWRDWCRENGIGEIYLAYVQSFDIVDPNEYGYDAAIEFPPNVFSPEVATHLVEPLNENFKCNIYDWKSMVNRSNNYTNPEYKLFRGVCPSWDNTPRRKNESTVLINSNPDDFRKWVYNASKDTIDRFDNQDERLIFINAWNEWAEGAYLEPDGKYGYAYLNSIKEAIKELNAKNIISQTYSLHNHVFNNRINEINKIFNTSKISEKYKFLVDYYKFLNLINKKYPQSFRILNGQPSFVFGDNNIKLLDRDDLNKIYKTTLKTDTCIIISFVILQYNNTNQTIECIESIKRLNDDRVRIIIVDNDSILSEKENLKKEFENDPLIRVIFNSKNTGFAAGNNIGYRYAKNTLNSDFIAIINNDTIINQETFIHELVTIFEEWSYSVLGPDIQIPDGRHENPYNNYIFNIQQNVELMGIRKKEKELLLKSEQIEWSNFRVYSYDKDFIINPILQGAALILSPIFITDHESVFEEVSFLYGEEFVLSANSLVNGELLLYSNKICILHKEGITTESLVLKDKMLHGYNGAIKSLKRSTAILVDELKREKNTELIVVKYNQLSNDIFTKKKNILFDIFFSQGGIHGGGEYGKAVFKELSETINKFKDVELWVVANPKLSIDNWVWDICRNNQIKVIHVKNYDAITQVVNTNLFTTFFTPAIVMYSHGYEYMKSIGKGVKLNSKKTKVIGTLHDIRDFELAFDFEKTMHHNKKLNCLPKINLNEKESKQLILRKKEEAGRLRKMYCQLCESDNIDTIITVSEYSKKAILSKITDCNDKLKVFYAPMKHRPNASSFTINNKKFDLNDFALIINASRTEKNAAAAIKAFDNIFLNEEASIKISDDFRVVVLGVNSIKEILNDPLKNLQRFVFLPQMPSNNLEYLYQNTKLFIFTSLSEGFGYPPLEAMSYNKLCLVSNVTSIPEICGDAVIYADPYEIDSIENGIIKALVNGVSSKLISEQYVKITDRQNSDLKELIELIIDK